MNHVTSTEGRRISISLTGKAASVVQELGDKLDLSEGAVVRRAIGLLDEIVSEEERGAKLLIREPGSDEAVQIKLVYSP